MEISCYRDRELAREPRLLPAANNLVHTTLARCSTSHNADKKRLQRNIPFGCGSHDGKDVLSNKRKTGVTGISH
jgi:hypothetical protein